MCILSPCLSHTPAVVSHTISNTYRSLSNFNNGKRRRRRSRISLSSSSSNPKKRIHIELVYHLPRFNPNLHRIWNFSKHLSWAAKFSVVIYFKYIVRCDYYNLSDKLIPYTDAWSWQKQMVDAKQALLEADGYVCDTLVVLQHPPVYTLGTRSSEKFLHFDLKHSPIDIYRTERGGEVTYHGPGQLVMYPIMNLRHHKMDLHWYLRALEEVIIRALWDAFSLKGSRIDGLTGVWIGNQKVAAIGIRASKWITYHGLAINVTTDLEPFTKIVPCGISDRPVGSLFKILKNASSMQDVEIPRLKDFWHTLDTYKLLDLTLKSFLKEFSAVFQVDLVEKIAQDFRGIQ